MGYLQEMRTKRIRYKQQLTMGSEGMFLKYFNKNIHNNILKVSDHTKEHKVVYVETNSEINDKKTY